jgi:hypothetical protein
LISLDNGIASSLPSEVLRGPQKVLEVNGFQDSRNYRNVCHPVNAAQHSLVLDQFTGVMLRDRMIIGPEIVVSNESSAHRDHSA